MNEANQIHLTIDRLEQIVQNAKDLHAKNPNTTSQIVRLTKTSWRQCNDQEDGVECALLTSCTIPENIEG